MNNHRYPNPFIVVSGGVETAGQFGDLKQKAGSVSVGLYDKTTYGIATGSGNGNTFFIGYSSTHTRDEITKFFNTAQNPNKSHFFRGKDIIKFEYSNPIKSQGERVVLGWTGVDGCNAKNFAYECGKSYGLRIELTGSPIFRNWARTLTQEIYVKTPCCDSNECETGCPDGNVDCEWVNKEFARKINEHVQLSRTGVKARYITNTFSATSPTHFDYCLSVCDAGDSVAMGKVQAGVTAGRIERVGREGGVSTYKVTCIASSPTAYTPVGSVPFAECGVCPSGFTVSGAVDTYNIVANEATYANAAALVTAYQNATLKTFSGVISAPNVTDDKIPVTAHGFQTGTKVLYTNGGGTTIVGLTSGTNYYVINSDVNTVKLATTLANALAGTAIDITATGVGASHTLTASGYTATLMSSNPTTEVFNLVVPSGVTVNANSNDTVLLSRTTGAMCVPDARSPISWVQCGSHFKVQRTLCMTLPRKECAAGNHLADMQAFFATDPTAVSGSLAVSAGTDCADRYTINQWSNCMDEACLSRDTASFEDLQGYNNGVTFGNWAEVEVAIPEYDADKKCGLEITAELTEQFFSDCSLDLNDFYETSPIRIEVSWIENQITGLSDNCGDIGKLPKAKKMQFGNSSFQSGEWLLREYIKNGAYEQFGWDFANPRLREVLDGNRRNQVDRKAFYKCFYLQYATDKGNRYNFDQKAEIDEACIWFKENDPNAAIFAQAVEAVTSKFGVVLKERI